MARPLVEVDPKIVEKLASIGCKITEIAIHLGVSTDTLHRRFAAELRKGRTNLKMNLRQWQLKSAERGNVAMLIWLGKQLLKQSDKMEQKNQVTVTQDVEYVTEWAKHATTPKT